VKNILEINNSAFIFKTKKIVFSEVPFDINGYDGVTFDECTKDVDIKGFSKVEFTTIVIDLTQDLETIRKKMDRLCRRSIDYAKKDGIIIRMNQGYEIFNSINSEFRKAKGLSKHNLDIEYMEKNGVLFLADYEGQTLAGHYYLSDGKNFRFLLNASKRLEVTGNMNKIVGNANRLMIWEAICYAKACGISTYDMGGYYTGKEPDPEKEGINKFKKSFGGQVVTHYFYQKDYSRLYYIGRKFLALSLGLMLWWDQFGINIIEYFV
jgi:lipid II:glycine glycyltransferase (peptidoglycan interpeptide bridge formation enzyme)